MLPLVMAVLLATDTAPPATDPAPAQVNAATVKEKKICKVDTDDSASRLRKRVCMTPTEWERVETGKDVNDLKQMGAH